MLFANSALQSPVQFGACPIPQAPPQDDPPETKAFILDLLRKAKPGNEPQTGLKAGDVLKYPMEDGSLVLRPVMQTAPRKFVYQLLTDGSVDKIFAPVYRVPIGTSVPADIRRQILPPGTIERELLN
jgi:hypothetical protein